MTMSDPIADMLTRIRNANTAKHDTVDVPSSKMKIAIADILVNEGYIEKYDPGLRVYANSAEMPKVLGGLGTAIVSTNKGVITDKEARKLGVGGEVLCFVW